MRWLAILLLLWAGIAAAAEPVPSGKVSLVEGDVTFHDADGKPRKPAAGEPLHAGESIVTGKDGEVHLEMEDGGFIAVRPNTRLSVTDFKAEGDHRVDRIVIELLEGTLRSITGWIARFRHDSYTIRTPTAALGVRGTDHEPHVIPVGSPLGEPGTYDKVNQGRTYIETRHGRLHLSKGQSGFAHHRIARPPRRLKQVPKFYVGTRHDARIDRRYKEIQQRLEEKREERKKTVEERRARLDEKREERREELQERREERQEQLQERREQRQERLREQREEAQQRRSAQQERAQQRRQQTQERRRQAPEKRGRRE